MGICIVIYAIVPVTCARFENEALKQLKEDMEELKRAKQERKDIKKEFEPVFEEEKKQVEEVERVTGMNYEEAVERYNITQIAPNSETLRNHYKRLGKNKEYRK